MKILIISHEYPPIGGGGANACMNLAREYGDAGHKVNIVTAWYEGTEEYFVEGNVTINRVKSKRTFIDHCSFTEMLDFLLKARPVVDKLEKEKHFDICQAFFGIPSGPLGLYLKKKYGLPYIIRFGGGDIPGAQKRFALVYKVLSPAIKSVWRNAAVLVANSKGLKDRAEKFYNGKEIKVIPNGVSLLSAPKEPIVKNDDEIVLLFVSRLIEGKGVQDVIPMMTEISKACHGIGKKVVLRIVGDGPYREELERITMETGTNSFVEFAGHRSKDELSAFYMGADIFVFPSRSEGMPNAVLEAMAYGLPVVMTPCEGSEELIHGNGFVCKVDEFKERIMELSSSSNLREDLGNKSLGLVRDMFSWRRTAVGYMNLFEKMRTPK